MNIPTVTFDDFIIDIRSLKAHRITLQDFFFFVLAILVPPLPVFLRIRFNVKFFVSVALTFLKQFPIGILYAFFIIYETSKYNVVAGVKADSAPREDQGKSESGATEFELLENNKDS